MSSVDWEMSTLSTARIPETHSCTVATDTWRGRGGGGGTFHNSNNKRNAAEVLKQSVQGKISHHGDRDGEHALQQHVYGSERGGRYSLKQSVQHSQSLWRVQVHLERQNMTNMFVLGKQIID